MARQEHYIPQLYLKGFVDPKALNKHDVKPYLWCVNVEQSSIKAKSPKNVAKAVGFYDYKSYDVSIEDHLQKIEALTAPIIEQLRNNDFDLTEEKRFHLSVYIGLQIGRVPAYRDFVQAFEVRKVQSEIKRILKGKDENINIVPPENFSDYLIGVSLKAGLDYWTKIVFSMNWVFILSPKEVEFYFSDNPASLIVPFGMPFKVDENLRLWFPLSPSCALLGHFGDVPDGFVEAVDSEIAIGFNVGILPTIQKYAFCSSKAQAEWVLKHYQAIGKRPASSLSSV